MAKAAKSHLWPLLVTSGVAGGILAILAPYGTHQYALYYRAVFWIGLCFAGGLGTAAANALVDKSSLTPASWVRVAFQSFGATLAVWLCFLALTVAVQGPPTSEFYYLIPFYIWIISAIICGVGELMRTRKLPSANGPETARPAIIDRLKPSLRSADIYALSAEDHYVRVQTSRGDDLILMRLADAVKDMAPLAGLQTHRSWWVAEAGVKQVTKTDGKLGITLKNDVTAPVSRSQAKTVREANWV